MSSRPAEPRSISSQLVLLFALAAAFLLFSGLGLLYWIVVRHAFEEDKEVLTDKVFALQSELERPGGSAALQEQLNVIRPNERAGYQVRVIDSSGRIVAETPGMANVLAPGIFPPPGHSAKPMTKPKDFQSRDRRLYSLGTAVRESGGERYTLQVAQDRTADERFMKEFAALVVAVLACGVVAAGAIGITVTRRGLRPLTQMTAALERVAPTHLDERLQPAGWPRELQPLALGFDQMLERLQQSFMRLSQFSADLAHELRTPIANIRGEAEVSLTRARTSDEYRNVIESNLVECERLSAIIDSLLFLARAEAPDRQIERTRLDARAACE